MLHHTTPALELEFYIPVAIWDHPATKALLQDIYTLVHGATIVGGAKGVWHGQAENTNLVKVLIRNANDAFTHTTLPAIRSSIDRAMTAWAAHPRHQQEAFMFTIRSLTVHETQENV